MKKLTCHCGGVEIEISLPGGLKNLTRCNCSLSMGEVLGPTGNTGKRGKESDKKKRKEKRLEKKDQKGDQQYTLQ